MPNKKCIECPFLGTVTHDHCLTKKCITENPNCDEPTPPSTTGKEVLGDKPDDHYSFASGINYITNLLSTAVFDFPIEGKRDYISFNFYPDVLIYEKYFGDIQNLLKKYDEYYISDYVHDYFSKTALDFEVNKKTLSCLNRSELEANG